MVILSEWSHWGGGQWLGVDPAPPHQWQDSGTSVSVVSNNEKIVGQHIHRCCMSKDYPSDYMVINNSDLFPEMCPEGGIYHDRKF